MFTSNIIDFILGIILITVVLPLTNSIVDVICSALGVIKNKCYLIIAQDSEKIQKLESSLDEDKDICIRGF